jgi:hypothetical protein
MVFKNDLNIYFKDIIANTNPNTPFERIKIELDRGVIT